MTINELKKLRESENKVEFKEAKGGNFSYSGGNKLEPKERRRCILGYVTAFANEGGGYLVLGMSDTYPHEVVGTMQESDSIGKLEQDIYTDTKIRVDIDELSDEQNKRIVIIKIPSRPAGKVYKFEDVPLMRVGESLLPMSDEYYLKIVQEQEPDFSARICEGLTIRDLEHIAIQKMKEAYSEKQGNLLFTMLSDTQALCDLDLLVDNKLTYAALILLGKSEAIRKFLPQIKIFIEYRNHSNQIIFDARYEFQEAYFTMIDKLWETINLRNTKIPIQQGMYIFDIHSFNKEVIREAINNAVAHRDYRKTSEIVIKQYQESLIITNPGGFPLGVNIENLLTINSTPRNRRLADIMSKTGIVERSGQGVDKIFYQCLTEAKPEPDYNSSDDFQVELKLSSIIEDKSFAIFIKKIQQERKEDEQLGVQEIIGLNKVRKDETDGIEKSILKKLEKWGLIQKVGKTRRQTYKLSIQYYALTDKKGSYLNERLIDENQIGLMITQHFNQFETAKMKDFELLFRNYLSREQIKYTIYRLADLGFLDKRGTGIKTEYFIGKSVENFQKFMSRAVELGITQMKELGEIKA